MDILQNNIDGIVKLKPIGGILQDEKWCEIIYNAERSAITEIYKKSCTGGFIPNFNKINEITQLKKEIIEYQNDGSLNMDRWCYYEEWVNRFK